MKSELEAEEVVTFLSCSMGKCAGGQSFVHQHGCCNINVKRFSKLRTAIAPSFIEISTRNLQRYLRMGLFTLCKNFARKVPYLNV